MTDAKQSEIASELAYVRALAEEGRFAPLLGGRIYVLWGSLMALAAFATWLDAIGVAGFENVAGWTIWLAAGAVGWGVSFLFSARARRMPGAATVGNRTARAAWLAVGLFVSLFFATLMLVHDDYVGVGLPRYFLFSLMFPVAFGLYGVAFFATAAAARATWFRYVAILAWGFSIGGMFLLASPHQMLLAAAGSVCCAVLPGAALMRGEPRDIV